MNDTTEFWFSSSFQIQYICDEVSDNGERSVWEDAGAQAETGAGKFME